MFQLLALGLLALSVPIVMAMDEEIEQKFQKQQGTIDALTRQIMMQQLVYEEGNRAAWDSGIKSLRGTYSGTRPYFAQTHDGRGSVFAIHDHSQNMRTCGFGEIVVMLNGVEFRTRHNDYAIKMPVENNKKYQAVKDLPFPEVPPSVLAKETVEEQAEEMRKYFESFKKQTPDKLDYRPYFKPILCYLEGAWTSSSEKIDEPFASDRHQIDATTWWDLTEKVRYTAYTGRKSNKENYSFLPMKIMNINNDTGPEFAQWNYRIVCAPLEDDIPLKNFRIVDDLPKRMADKKTVEEMGETRHARYFLSGINADRERHIHMGFLDKLMSQIPGMDNYGCDLPDLSFGITADVFNEAGTVLNSCYYHRNFQGKKGAMGRVTRRRGFNDQNIFMAQNTQEKIPAVGVTDCDSGECLYYEQRWSYAIPLEIIYLTPLYQWNPWNIPVYMWKDPEFKAVNADGRNGGFTPDKAYKGARANIYYLTPEEFFQGADEPDKDPADTSQGIVGVLDNDGNVRRVAASGTRIFLPELPGIGKIRLRYPIAPIHSDGSTIWKELQVLKDIVMEMERYSYMLHEQPTN